MSDTSRTSRGLARPRSLVVVLAASVLILAGLSATASSAVLSKTEKVKDIPGVSVPLGDKREVAAVGDRLFFNARGQGGFELWASDGTAAGTGIVTDIDPGGSSSPSQLTAFKGRLFFAATTSGGGTELWSSDGTPDGTAMVKDINPGTGSSGPSELTVVGGTLFFAANDGTAGRELWKSDGTPDGTRPVLALSPSSGGSFPDQLTKVGNRLFFSAYTEARGFELYTSDGTGPGTTLAAEINPGTGFDGSSMPTGITDVGGTAYFSADDGTHGVELWKSDGTAPGTVLVQDLNPNAASSDPGQITAVGGTAFFTATDGPPSGSSHGTELFRTTTTGGAVLVKDINTDNNSTPSGLTDVAGTLFFAARSNDKGTELWKSDGTQEGTVMVKDINPSTNALGSSNPGELTAFGGRLYFSATDTDTSSNQNYEPWTSDGTAAGTVPLADIGPGGTTSSSPRHFTSYRGGLAFDVVVGSVAQLWRLVDPNPAPPPAPAPSGASAQCTSAKAGLAQAQGALAQAQAKLKKAKKSHSSSKKKKAKKQVQAATSAVQAAQTSVAGSC